VHDLSTMTSVEARSLLASPPTEGLFVRYLYDTHGEPSPCRASFP
jgi:hypothetical protein